MKLTIVVHVSYEDQRLIKSSNQLGDFVNLILAFLEKRTCTEEPFVKDNLFATTNTFRYVRMSTMKPK